MPDETHTKIIPLSPLEVRGGVFVCRDPLPLHPFPFSTVFGMFLGYRLLAWGRVASSQ